MNHKSKIHHALFLTPIQVGETIIADYFITGDYCFYRNVAPDKHTIAIFKIKSIKKKS